MGMLLFACAIGFIALGTTEWIEKSYVFRNIIFILPRFDLYPFITTFNSNEIGGALAWLIPYCGGMIVYPWRNTVKAKQAISVIAFITTFTAAILGQSRFAIIGVLISLFVLVFTLFPKGRIQFYTAASLMIITILQAGLIFSRLSPKNTGNFPRDEISFNNRFDIWNSAFKIIRDHPLTGAGMNNFRIKAVRRDYPVPKYDYDLLPGQTSPRILPHTHNEMLQMGTDFGIPGIILFIGLYFSTGKVLRHCWNSSNTSIRSASIILGASLFAHAFFGLGDAIPIWDRFHFIQWIMIGLLCAHFRLNTIQIFQPQKLT
jgi:O-antigen ligase